MGYAYRYDQLNRLKAMTAFAGLDSNRWMPANGTTAWNTLYSYDPNGNLLALTRNDASGTLMDNLSYRYDTVSRRLLNNRLLSVDDPVNGGHGDIYDLHEYQYDAIGNLVKDESERIDSIIWDAYGKVYQILRTDTSSRPELEFRYDATGNRIMKIAKHGVNQEDWTYSIYSRDATGNVIDVYERKWTSTTALTSPDADLVLQVPTHPGLGSGLIGIKVNGIYLTNGPVLTEITTAGTATALANAVNAYETEQFDFTAEVDGDLVFLFTEEEYTEPLNFEILNTDVDFIGSEYFDFIAPKISGFKPHSGTFTQVPLIETVSLQELHLYGNSRLGIKTPYLEIDKRQVKSAYAGNYGDSLYLSYLDSRVIPLVNPATGPFFEHEKGLKQYELSNHLGNVLVVFQDKKVSHEGDPDKVGHYTASLLSVQDYFPFGWTMPRRKYSLANYRHGFQRQEMDDEIGGEDAFAFFKYRVNDNRIGKFWSVDPLAAKYPHNSSYAFSENRLIDGVELEGLERAPTGHSPYGTGSGPFAGAISPHGATNTSIKKGHSDEVKVAAQVILGFVPILGQMLDVLDTYDAYMYGDQTDRIIALAAWVPGGDILKAVRKINRLTAATADAKRIADGYYASYKAGTTVLEHVTVNTEEYVRVYKEGQNKAAGQWMMKKSELLDEKGNMLTPQQIKDKFSLGHIPDKIVDVTVPPGTTLRTGIARDVPHLGTSGGGIQVELMEEIPDGSFKNPRNLEP